MSVKAPPWIIWTRQRTGGIALFEALRPLAEHPLAESECFDGSVETRQFSHVPGRHDRLALLDRICREGWCMKHCYDGISPDFNRELAAISNDAGYRHIHLTRRDELARLVSLGVAENEVTWLAGSDLTEAAFAEIKGGQRQMKPLDVESLVARSRSAERQASIILPLLTRYKQIWTEDITSSRTNHRRRVLATILKHLCIPADRLGELDARLEGRGQNTFAVWDHVPNLRELRRAMQ